MKIALTIAGFDSTAGAGVIQDIKVFHHFGVYGISVITALTAQNTYEIKNIKAIDKDFFEEQLFTILSDIRPNAVKTGMLYTKEVVKVVKNVIQGFDLPKLVIDPVTVSTTGVALVQDGVLDLIKNELFPLATIITPNIYEASLFTGVKIESEEDMVRAAEKLKELGTEIVVITGGHFSKSGKTLDLYFDGERFLYLSDERVEGEYHGTGCAFSASLTALLALGVEGSELVKKAKDFITKTIKNAHTFGKGLRLLNIRN
ncbi:MAG: bifunctional hydroxymethylpyrimidine kinase/phosphomethylpyrimidine kinase [Thermodesulfovibrionales bacterium]|nr:bifunctional hydroxymethylpyrimidine kinase/phosphomethylpyrimidine kinase [Thermodesulfovibrionales bacterium]